jgi:hypothetical protein
MLDLTHHLLTSLGTSIDLAVLDPSAIDLSNHFNLAHTHTHINMELIAQQFKQDMMGDATKSWNNFVKSGQIWALIIGVAVGYLFRSITNS